MRHDRPDWAEISALGWIALLVMAGITAVLLGIALVDWAGGGW